MLEFTYKIKNKQKERGWLYDWANHYSGVSVYIFLYTNE